MTMIKPGSRWKSQVCTAEAVLVRPSKGGGLPQCGGIDMVPIGDAALTIGISEGLDGGCAVGKRYRSEASGVEMLCTKAGKGTLGYGGEALDPVEAKKLPSSD